MPKAYLAGPIAGLSYAGTVEWRRVVSEQLRDVGIEAFSPMRAKEYLKHVTAFAKDCTPYGAANVLSSNRGIMTRDRFDATRCDLMFVYLYGAQAVSIGTVMELAWADLLRIPIVCVIEKEGNPHEHGMVLEAIGFRVPSLSDGIDITKAILLQ